MPQSELHINAQWQCRFNTEGFKKKKVKVQLVYWFKHLSQLNSIFVVSLTLYSPQLVWCYIFMLCSTVWPLNSASTSVHEKSKSPSVLASTTRIRRRHRQAKTHGHHLIHLCEKSSRLTLTTIRHGRTHQLFHQRSLRGQWERLRKTLW